MHIWMINCKFRFSKLIIFLCLAPTDGSGMTDDWGCVHDEGCASDCAANEVPNGCETGALPRQEWDGLARGETGYENGYEAGCANGFVMVRDFGFAIAIAARVHSCSVRSVAFLRCAQTLRLRLRLRKENN